MHVFPVCNPNFPSQTMNLEVQQPVLFLLVNTGDYAHFSISLWPAVGD